LSALPALRQNQPLIARHTSEIVLIPTTYHELTISKSEAFGKVGIVIYGNHAIRAAVTTMQQIFQQIRTDGDIHNANKAIVPIDEIFRPHGIGNVEVIEEAYLR
jgi:phosphoenolpyruvate phosphomutase